MFDFAVIPLIKKLMDLTLLEYSRVDFCDLITLPQKQIGGCDKVCLCPTHKVLHQPIPGWSRLEAGILSGEKSYSKCLLFYNVLVLRLTGKSSLALLYLRRHASSYYSKKFLRSDSRYRGIEAWKCWPTLNKQANNNSSVS